MNECLVDRWLKGITSTTKLHQCNYLTNWTGFSKLMSFSNWLTFKPIRYTPGSYQWFIESQWQKLTDAENSHTNVQRIIASLSHHTTNWSGGSPNWAKHLQWWWFQHSCSQYLFPQARQHHGTYQVSLEWTQTLSTFKIPDSESTKDG